MKINSHWRRHVEAWRESGLSQADYCRQQGLNHKIFSVWTRRVQVDLSLDASSFADNLSPTVISFAINSSPKQR